MSIPKRRPRRYTRGEGNRLSIINDTAKARQTVDLAPHGMPEPLLKSSVADIPICDGDETHNYCLCVDASRKQPHYDTENACATFTDKKKCLQTYNGRKFCTFPQHVGHQKALSNQFQAACAGLHSLSIYGGCCDGPQETCYENGVKFIN